MLMFTVTLIKLIEEQYKRYYLYNRDLILKSDNKIPFIFKDLLSRLIRVQFNYE